MNDKAKKPKRHILRSLLLLCFFVAIAAFGVSYVLGSISIRQVDHTITIEKQPVRSILMRKKLHIRNIPAKVSTDELNALFESHGAAARFERIDESEGGYGRSGYV